MFSSSDSRLVYIVCPKITLVSGEERVYQLIKVSHKSFSWTFKANFQRRAEREQQEVYEKAIHHATLRSTGGMSGTSNDQAFIWQKLHKEANEIEQRAKQLGSSHLHHKPLRQAAKDLRSSSSLGPFMVANHAAYPRRQ